MKRRRASAAVATIAPGAGGGAPPAAGGSAASSASAARPSASSWPRWHLVGGREERDGADLVEVLAQQRAAGTAATLGAKGHGGKVVAGSRA